ncbi:putative pentatricopeptide [Rosa chinensis]|uniref:Putative pentatricopeptide n=1 Tax=Rosa chinensis TaxID=74649 RepID=A0A2P6S8G1_ROSCH|nr:putative pentatricopeptide [Rosa chinensis]
MFARCGDPQSVMKVFDNMARRDFSAWTAAIGAMAMQGNGERAIELFDDRLKQGVKPDEVVFVAVLTACSHVGLLVFWISLFFHLLVFLSF